MSLKKIWRMWLFYTSFRPGRRCKKTHSPDFFREWNIFRRPVNACDVFTTNKGQVDKSGHLQSCLEVKWVLSGDAYCQVAVRAVSSTWSFVLGSPTLLAIIDPETLSTTSHAAPSWTLIHSPTGDQLKEALRGLDHKSLDKFTFNFILFTDRRNTPSRGSLFAAGKF